MQVSRSLQVPFYSNTSAIVHSETSQLVVPSHSVPQQPSLFFNTSQLPSTHFLNTSTPIAGTMSLTTQPPIIPTTTPIQSTVLPSASPVQPTVSPILPYRHYLIGTIEYTVSSVEIGQTGDNTNATITAIARRYLNLTTETVLATYTLSNEHISVRIGNLTVTAIRSEYDQFLIENLATRRVVFYVTDNTALLLATQAKTVLDTYSIEQWADSLGLQTLNVTFDLYVQIQTSFMSSSTFVATVAVSPQSSSSVPMYTTSAVLSSSSTALSLSLTVSSLQLVTSSSIRASQNTTPLHTGVTSLSGQIQQSLHSSSLQSTLLATQSISMPVQLMTSSLISTLVSLSSNRSALSIPATSTTESPVISTTSLMSVLNSTQPSQFVSRTQIPLSSSRIQITQAAQPPSAVISSGVSSVQQLTSNIQLMTSSLMSTLVSLSSNRSALSIPATFTTESPVISVTPSLMSVLNSTQPSQLVSRTQIPLSSSRIQITQAAQPPSAVISSGISSVQQLTSNIQLMTSSLMSTLVSLSSNRSALSIPATFTTESPVISTTSLMSVLNSTQPSQLASRTQIPLSSSRIQITQAVQPSSAVISSGISSVQQLTSNITSLPTLATVNSTQFPASTIMSLSPAVSHVTTQTPIVSMIRNISSSPLSSQINTSSVFPTQRVSISHSTAPSLNSSLIQSTQTVPLSGTPTTPPRGYHVLTDFNPGVGYLLQLTLNVSGRMVEPTNGFYNQTELDLIILYSRGLEIEEASVSNRRKRDVFNTSSQIACGIIESLTNIGNDQMIIVFYISREENELPLLLVTAETSKNIFDKLKPGNYTATLGYEFLSLSIYEEIFVDPHRISIIVGTTLGCCILVLLIILLVLCLYHCLHSNYIRADKWSPTNMSITYSNKGVYTGSSTKLMNEDEFEMEFTRNFSEGTQTLARDFLYGTGEMTRNSADYAFTLRTEPNIFSPFQIEETTRFIEETETSKYPSHLDPVPAPTIPQLQIEIEEERRRAKRAEASLLEIMASNRKHLADTSMFSDPSEAKIAEERANTAYEKSKKELAGTTGAVTPSSSYGSSLGSSRGAHRPWSGKGNKVAPSNEPTGGLTPQPKTLDWGPDSEQSVSSKSSRSMQLSGFRNVRPPNIMQVEPIPSNSPILVTPPPSYNTYLVDTHPKPIPVRVFRTDGHPVQMQPSVPSTPVTTATIHVIPSFNPFYTTAKKEHTSL